MSISMTGRSFIARTLGLFCALCLTLSIAARADASGCVLIITGDHGNPSGNAILAGTSAIADAQYVAKGYTVIRATTKAQIMAALNQPCLRHMVFTGHGVYSDENTPEAGIWLGPGAEDSDYVYASEIASMIPAAQRASMVSVVMNACGQLHSGWAGTFPNATIHGWSKKVTPWSSRCDQYFHGSGRINPKGAARGAETGGGLIDHPHDDRLSAQIVMIEKSPGRWIAGTGEDYSLFTWAIPEPLASEVGTKTFNVLVTDMMGGDVMLGGFTIAGGDCTAHAPMPHPAPDFMMVMTAGAFDAATANIDSIPSLLMAGEVFTAGNMTPVPPHKLMAAALVVTFGFIPAPPPCIGDADASGTIDFADITSVLANFGQTGPAFRPGDADGSGTVDFTDITTVLANWGSEC
jgi:hypothetical protein